MLRLDFNTFWEKVKLNRLLKIFPTIHYLEDDSGFTFIFKSGEDWDYITSVSMEEIRSFAESQERDFEEVLEEFNTTYLHDTTPLKESEYPEWVPRYLIKNKEEVIEPGKDVITESEDYEEFMISVMESMEKKVIAAVTKIPVEKFTGNPGEIDKTFGEFIRELMNSVNTLPFARKIKVFVKNGLKAGLESAEEEVGVDIGFTAVFSDKVKILTNQQLNGYTLPDGKAWYGIKGASKDLQIKILKQVQDDVINKRDHKEMTENIQEIFEGSGMAQAARIARSESNRFLNEAKLTGYIESGIEGHKAWAAVMDKKTSEICRRLHNKYFKKGIPFDEEFVDDTTGKKGLNPPGVSHPNCRCTLEFRKSKVIED